MYSPYGSHTRGCTTWLTVQKFESCAGSGFGPMMVTEDGGQLPEPGIFTDEAMDYYARRANETPNSLPRALYCDFLWEKRHDHKFTRRAIQAYLQ